ADDAPPASDTPRAGDETPVEDASPAEDSPAEDDPNSAVQDQLAPETTEEPDSAEDSAAAKEIRNSKKPFVYLLTRGEPGKVNAWRAQNTPLTQVLKPIGFEVTVLDTDGLRLEQPRAGFIRLKTDRRPRITAGVITKYVLPRAKPSVVYGARDDYGLAKLIVHRQIIPQEGDPIEAVVEIPLGDEGSSGEGAAAPRLAQGRYALDLGKLKLSKGDQLRITLEAIDFRGPNIGQSAYSDPVILHVTDERGVLAAMTETDERSARQLDAIIRRQLGIGESQ
ncbi:MAG: hypothetical protein N2C14_04210, partial [Planctomycetales bacterium]